MKSKSLLSLLLLASCATGERVDGDSADRQGDALDAIPQHPNASACQGGAYHCYALVRTDGMGDKRAAGGSGFGPADLASAYKLNTSLTPVFLIFQEALGISGPIHMGYAAALAFVLAMIIFAFTFVQRRVLERGTEQY